MQKIFFQKNKIIGLLSLVTILIATQAHGLESIKSKNYFVVKLTETLKILMPESSKGKNMLLACDNENTVKAQIKELEDYLGYQATSYKKLVPDGRYEEALVKENPDCQFYSINKAFLPCVAERFNTKLSFGGPNCHFTSLSSTNGISKKEIRHVGVHEFKARLALFYNEQPKDSTPVPGDLLLFNSDSHSGVYLGGDLVFHKKDLNKEFYFRVVKKLEVFYDDPGEWTPGPNYWGPYQRPTSTKVRKVQIFRRNSLPLSAWKNSFKDLAEYSVINFLKKNVIETIPNWKLGKVMGYWSEKLTEELVRTFDHLSASPEGKRLRTELESLRDQVFIAIEDGYFSSPYAGEKVIKRIWFFENDYSKEIITIIRSAFGKETSNEDVQRITDSIKALNGSLKGKSLVKILCS